MNPLLSVVCPVRIRHKSVIDTNKNPKLINDLKRIIIHLLRHFQHKNENFEIHLFCFFIHLGEKLKQKECSSGPLLEAASSREQRDKLSLCGETELTALLNNHDE